MSHLRLVTLILLAALIVPLGIASAQDGGGLPAEEQALVDRVRAAIRATEDYPAGIVLTTADSIDKAEIVLNDATFPGTTITAREYHQQFTRDADGLPNTVVSAVIDVSEEDARGVVTSYQLTGEMRTVGGQVYLQVTRASEDEAALDPMPEGWLLVDETTADQWPALDEIPLDDTLREVHALNVVDPDVLIVLDHVTHATLDDPVTLDNGVEADLIHLHITGDVLGAAMTDLQLQTADRDLSAVYAYVSADSKWDLSFWLDENDRIAQYAMTVDFSLFDVDLALLSPGAPEGAMFSQRQVFSMTSTITIFDAPTEAVAAPEIATQD